MNGRVLLRSFSSDKSNEFYTLTSPYTNASLDGLVPCLIGLVFCSFNLRNENGLAAECGPTGFLYSVGCHLSSEEGKVFPQDPTMMNRFKFFNLGDCMWMKWAMRESGTRKTALYEPLLRIWIWDCTRTGEEPFSRPRTCHALCVALCFHQSIEWGSI